MTVTRVDPVGFDWRSGAGGAAQVERIAAAAAAHDGRDALNEATRLELRHEGLGRAALLIGVEAGEAVGFALLHGLSGAGRPELDLVVTPAARRRGAGAELVAAALSAAGGIPLTAWSHGDHPGAAALAERTGFRAVRTLWLMRRPVAVPLPEAQPAEQGLRGYDGARDDAELLRVNAAAFAAHPEQGQLDLAGLRRRMAEDWFDPAGLLVAERDGRLVGFHWTKVHRTSDTTGEQPAGRPVGEVYVIGVDPAAHGSGLGRALLVAGLRHLERRGVGEVVLFVESDNAPAIGLYKKLGFTHAPADTDVLYSTA